ncbi:hypothetical protein BDY19DRAFT_504220 [Irpex rosettiformis]|uniref:Uncharacterized protein n=1 Tax=Irpex rosettiformis TaxID=378272 RepID=A0ACB8UEE8_9APHY|nr:hypothetical protein BDY19DRAFT_504220 [Irpex rosettiformis]
MFTRLSSGKISVMGFGPSATTLAVCARDPSVGRLTLGGGFRAGLGGCHGFFRQNPCLKTLYINYYYYCTVVESSFSFPNCSYSSFPISVGCYIGFAVIEDPCLVHVGICIDHTSFVHATRIRAVESSLIGSARFGFLRLICSFHSLSMLEQWTSTRTSSIYLG